MTAYAVGDTFTTPTARFCKKSLFKIKSIGDNGTVYAVDLNANQNPWAPMILGLGLPAIKAMQADGSLVWQEKI